MKKTALIIAALAASCAGFALAGIKASAATVTVNGVKDGETSVSCEFDADGDRVSDSFMNVTLASDGTAEIRSIFTAAADLTVPDTVEVTTPSGKVVYRTSVLGRVYPENGQDIKSVTLPDGLMFVKNNAVGYSLNGQRFERSTADPKAPTYGGKVSGFTVYCNDNTTGKSYAAANGFATAQPKSGSGSGTVTPNSDIKIERSDDINYLKWDVIANCTSISLYRRAAGAEQGELHALLDGGATQYFDMIPGGKDAEYYLIATVTEGGETRTITVGNASEELPSEQPAEEAKIEMGTPRLTIGSGTVTLNWDKVEAAGYIVKMDGEQVFDTQSGDITSYTKTGLKDYERHIFTVTPYEKTTSGTVVNGKESDSVSTLGVDSILNSAKADNNRSFTMYNKQGVNTTSSTVTLTDNDIAILEKFARENFTDEMTDAQKLETTLAWINQNVKYARTNDDWRTISGRTYTESVFTYKLGQCAQYNGAMVSMMRYLGYDANMITGYRGTWGGSYWQHFWGEVEIDGLKYIIETGNYGSSGDWSYLLTPYERADGKFITNCKNVPLGSFDDYYDFGDWGNWWWF